MKVHEEANKVMEATRNSNNNLARAIIMNIYIEGYREGLTWGWNTARHIYTGEMPEEVKE